MPTWTLFSAALAPLFLIAGWTLAAAQQVRFDARVQTISALAAVDAQQRWIMTSALIGLGACHLCTALGLRAARGSGRSTLALGGLCTLLVAAFPLGTESHERAHLWAASAAFVCLAVWPLLATVRGEHAPLALRPRVALLATLSLVGLLGWLAWALARERDIGLAERAAAAAQAFWPLLVTCSVRRTERHFARRS